MVVFSLFPYSICSQRLHGYCEGHGHQIFTYVEKVKKMSFWIELMAMKNLPLTSADDWPYPQFQVL
jgi:hypothetical protein